MIEGLEECQKCKTMYYDTEKDKCYYCEMQDFLELDDSVIVAAYPIPFVQEKGTDDQVATQSKENDENRQMSK